jgi:4-hydroxythreonine-4-phosphate dehydrogenase
VIPGDLNPANADYIIRALNAATDVCLEKKAAALVTAPIHKGNLNAAGIAFTGHTEYLAQRCGVKKTVMLFATPTHNIALQTTHLPLRAVADAITQNNVEETLSILYHALMNTFGIINPHIAVCGLNPHAGENGYLGLEEITAITPAIQTCVNKGWHVTGPLPADTAFIHSADATQPDAILAMYHDQALPIVKTLHFNDAVNITLGLPIIRTSVDHGTALSLAGTGRARADNLCAAVKMAINLKNT